jgi:membrane protein required for beta-lactamase induction
MKLIALLLGLLLERLLTHALHLREPRWFDRYLDWALARFRELRGGRALALTILLVLLPALPVALIAWVFQDLLLGIVYVAFAALVLVFSLGPRDLKDEVDDYIAALDRGDRQAAERVAREIMEHDAAQRTGTGPDTLDDAIFVQTNNRIFGVAFWFMLIGPAGAWLFRVSDLMRRRAVFEYRGRADGSASVPAFVDALQAVHGVLAWAPARLLALGYALAGSFEQALDEWRRTVQAAGARFFDTNDHLLAGVGRGALNVEIEPIEFIALPGIVRVEACMRLITRALLIWLVFASALVLIGWVR